MLLKPFWLNVVAYYEPSTLTVTYLVPSRATTNIPTGTSGDSFLNLKVMWTPQSRDVGTHTIAVRFSTQDGKSKDCSFQVRHFPYPREI